MTPTNKLSFLEDGFLGKKGKKARIERIKKIINHSPEVMVKVTGFTHDFKHFKTHLNYITRNATLELEDGQGSIYFASEDIQHLVQYWQSNHWEAKTHKDKTRITANLVLSMPYGTDAVVLKDAIRSFAQKTFADYRYVMALHQDTDNPHVHLTVQSCGFNGNRLQIKRGDPQQWREAFADELDKRGIDAEATPRAVRGIVFKSISQTIRQMKDRGIKLHTTKSMLENIRTLWTQDKHAIQPRPWEANIKAKQKTIRTAWLTLADAFRETDKALSDKIMAFVDAMPEPITKREMINQKIFHSVRDIIKAKNLLQDHPELKDDIDKIISAQHYANNKYLDNQQKEIFMKQVVSDIAHKRINGESSQSNIRAKENKENNDNHKFKDNDYEI
jgi:type IV secretion system T-DNA border endonuclease VirD2